MKRRYNNVVTVLIIFVLMTTVGCARTKELERLNNQQAETIMGLKEELARLNDDINALSQAEAELRETQLKLEQRLAGELEKGDLKVEMEDRGLVVTVLNKVLFDSGKTVLKQTSISTLNKVGTILKNDVPDQLIFVEGHTDTDPIKFSGFKSNWELSAARALEVVHFFIDKIGITPERVVAMGVGEFHPVATNATIAGKSQNRRVEIVISPKKFVKEKFATTAVGSY